MLIHKRKTKVFRVHERAFRIGDRYLYGVSDLERDVLAQDSGVCDLGSTIPVAGMQRRSDLSHRCRTDNDQVVPTCGRRWMCRLEFTWLFCNTSGIAWALTRSCWALDPPRRVNCDIVSDSLVSHPKHRVHLERIQRAKWRPLASMLVCVQAARTQGTPEVLAIFLPCMDRLHAAQMNRWLGRWPFPKIFACTIWKGSVCIRAWWIKGFPWGGDNWPDITAHNELVWIKSLYGNDHVNVVFRIDCVSIAFRKAEVRIISASPWHDFWNLPQDLGQCIVREGRGHWGVGKSYCQFVLHLRHSSYPCLKMLSHNPSSMQWQSWQNGIWVEMLLLYLQMFQRLGRIHEFENSVAHTGGNTVILLLHACSYVDGLPPNCSLELYFKQAATETSNRISKSSSLALVPTSDSLLKQPTFEVSTLCSSKADRHSAKMSEADVVLCCSSTSSNSLAALSW